jgi:hypothetical protein
MPVSLKSLPATFFRRLHPLLSLEAGFAFFFSALILSSLIFSSL